MAFGRCAQLARTRCESREGLESEALLDLEGGRARQFGNLRALGAIASNKVVHNVS